MGARRLRDRALHRFGGDRASLWAWRFVRRPAAALRLRAEKLELVTVASSTDPHRECDVVLNESCRTVLLAAIYTPRSWERTGGSAIGVREDDRVQVFAAWSERDWTGAMFSR
jgi:hypothetical protein